MDRDTLQAEAKSVAYEIDCVVGNYEKRQVVPLDENERQMVARLKMWSKRLTDATIMRGAANAWSPFLCLSRWTRRAR